MHQYSSDPIEPAGGTTPTALALVEEWRELPLPFRLFLFAALSIGAWGGLVGGYSLLREIQHPIAYAISFLILEPIGFCCLVAVVVVVSPQSLVAPLLSGALGRARLALLLMLVTLTSSVVGVFAWIAFEWLRLQR